MNLLPWIKNLAQTARRALGINRSEDVKRKPAARPKPKPTKHKRQSVREWCKNYQQRNGWIVGAVSPVSIYYKTHRYRSRKAKAAAA